MMLLKAMQMYFPLIFKVRGPITSSDVVATREWLKYHLMWLGGRESLEQLSLTCVPVSALVGPVIIGVMGPSFKVRHLRIKVMLAVPDISGTVSDES